MSDDILNIGICQFDLVWNEPRLNLDRMAYWLSRSKDVDVVIFPEVCLTHPHLDPSAQDDFIWEKLEEYLVELQSEFKIALVGSCLITEGKYYLNRFFMATGESRVMFSDKRHLSQLPFEERGLWTGLARPNISFGQWKIRPSICYDLHFPLWPRGDSQYDMLICVANLSARRVQSWRKLLVDHALENQCYVLGVDSVGVDRKNFSYTGGSLAVDPTGQVIAEASDYAQMLEVCVHQKEIMRVREGFPILDQRDQLYTKR